MSNMEDIIAIPKPTTPPLKRQNAFHEKITIKNDSDVEPPLKRQKNIIKNDSDDESSSIQCAQRIRVKKVNLPPKRKS